MEMKRIEADTLEEAYSEAAKELACSVTEINYEIVQHPSEGVMGLFKKRAIIIAVRKSIGSAISKEEEDISTSEPKETIISKNSSIKVRPKKRVTLKEVEEKEESKELKEKSSVSNISTASSVVDKKDTIVDSFFNDEKVEVNKSEVLVETTSSSEIDSVENVAFDDDRDSPENKERSLEIENKLKTLIEAGCFEIDTVEVDVFNGIAHIFVDGDDAALLIGKEGYRYNALSYMLFNWINSSYDLYIKLEIAEFIQTQEEMIDNYLKPIAEHIIEHGRGKTKPLDGILVQIALEKLRAMFPNKYIAIKTGKDGKKFILINNFNNQKPN